MEEDPFLARRTSASLCRIPLLQDANAKRETRKVFFLLPTFGILTPRRKELKVYVQGKWLGEEAAEKSNFGRKARAKGEGGGYLCFSAPLLSARHFVGVGGWPNLDGRS